MVSFVQVLDFIGTLAFAISGIRLASAKRFDLFGAYVVGVTTAIGGGTMRDLLLSQPPLDDKSFLPHLLSTGTCLGYCLPQMVGSTKQHLVFIRHHWFGTFHGHWC